MSQVRTMVLVGTACWFACRAAASAQTTAFYYGPEVPQELLALYDQIVVQPAHVPDLLQFEHVRAAPVAYLSVGEVAQTEAAALDPGWVVARNPAWRSAVMDVCNHAYRAFVLSQLDRLWHAGYRRFFLDTLDSYQLVNASAEQRERARRALVELITSMARAHPDAHWLLNRGFELLPQVASVVHGVAAESLFDRWDAASARYVEVPETDRAWLLARLNEAREQYQLPITVIDYRPAAQRSQARHTAGLIAALGFQPWVSNATLTNIGVGAWEVLPRRVLIIHDAAEVASVARWLTPVVEHLGYVPEYRSLADALPTDSLADRYQGIVTVLANAPGSNRLGDWLMRQSGDGLHVVMFGALGFAAEGGVAREFGIAPAPPHSPPLEPSAVLQRDTLVGFEAEPGAHDLEGIPIEVHGPDVHQHLQIRDRAGRNATAIATAPWGGVAVSHAFATRGLSGQRAWVLDPFEFLTRALALPELPLPDLSTESGRRLALFVIDARGLGEHAQLRGAPSIASVLEARVFAQYGWPHAIDLDSGVAELSIRDRTAAARLLAAPGAYRWTDAALAPIALEPIAGRRSLSALLPLLAATPSYADPAGLYLDRQLIDSFAATEDPRRLQPIVVHYHAYAAGTPGGIEALQNVYARLSVAGVFPVRADDYAARVRAFREQVLARALDGSFVIAAGSALRTLRVPSGLGLPDLRASHGVACVRSGPQGNYVTFQSHGPRQLKLGQTALPRPHLTQANGRIEAFAVDDRTSDALRIRLHIRGTAALEFELAGLPQGSRCEWLQAERRSALTLVHDRISIKLRANDTGSAQVLCRRRLP